MHEALANLITSIEGHLSACQRRQGDNDPEVQVAYDTLRTMAQRYEDAVFDAYDEVTPFEIPNRPTETEPAELTEDGRFALFARRDYVIDDVAALLEVGRRSYREVWTDDDADAAVSEVTAPAAALYQILHAHGIDGMAAVAEDAGLIPVGGTLWVQVVDDDDDTIEDDPFSVVDEGLVVYRVDEIYEDDEDTDDDDDDTDGGDAEGNQQ